MYAVQKSTKGSRYGLPLLRTGALCRADCWRWANRGNNQKSEQENEIGTVLQKQEEISTKTEKPISNLKISIFNNPTELLKKLSENGIGKLENWQNPEEMGWGSLTSYYQFGPKKDEYGMQNNLAYYIEGQENFAKNLLLNLNINNSQAKNEAVQLFSETANKTFKSLEIEIPKGLMNSIKNSKEFKIEDETMTTNFTIEKSRIETFKLEIISK